MQVIDDMAANGLPAPELTKAKLNLVRDLPDAFATNRETASAFGDLVRLGLPDDWYAGYGARLTAVGPADVRGLLARKSVVFVVVGDLAKVRADVEALGLGKPEVYDLDGKRR